MGQPYQCVLIHFSSTTCAQHHFLASAYPGQHSIMPYSLKWGAPTIKEHGPVICPPCVFHQAPQCHRRPFRFILNLSGLVHHHGCSGALPTSLTTATPNHLPPSHPNRHLVHASCILEQHSPQQSLHIGIRSLTNYQIK